MARPLEFAPVIVYNQKGKPIGTYESVETVAQMFESSTDTVRHYINNGQYWKKKKVFVDFALEVS